MLGFIDVRIAHLTEDRKIWRYLDGRATYRSFHLSLRDQYWEHRECS